MYDKLSAETSFLNCPTLISVEPLDDYHLIVSFDNGETKNVDFVPYFQYEVFEPLKDKELFDKVKVRYGGVAWNDDIDLASASLYDAGVPTK